MRFLRGVAGNSLRSISEAAGEKWRMYTGRNGEIILKEWTQVNC